MARSFDERRDPEPRRSSTGERAGRRSRAVPRGRSPGCWAGTWRSVSPGAGRAAGGARTGAGRGGRRSVSRWRPSDMEGALRWLADVVRTVARSSPSLALVLAARYTAAPRRSGTADRRRPPRRAGPPRGVARRALATRRSPGCSTPRSPCSSTQTARAGVVVAAAAASVEPAPRRTGLADAQLARRSASSETRAARLDRRCGDPRRSTTWRCSRRRPRWGWRRRRSRRRVDYAGQRRQFGSALLSFAGMRAILGGDAAAGLDASPRSSSRRSTPARPRAVLELAATAGRAAVDVAIDAIQVHGGYGYIDEYPVAGLLRDAVSLRARTSRRSSVARLADARFGPIG